MNILVTGGSGFVGTRLVEKLLEEGHVVQIFDKNPSNKFKELVIIGDVRDQAALDKALAGVDVVYNLAAEHWDDVRPVSLYYDVNVQGARNVVQAAELNNVRNIVFTSTVAVYSLEAINPTETSPVDPFNEYGKSKLEAEGVFNEWVESEPDRSLTIVRFVVIFGEGNKGNVHNLITQVANNKFIMVGSGENKKSMAYVGNVVKFLSQVSMSNGKNIFNYSDKPDITANNLIKLIRSELGMSTSFLIRLPYWLGLVGGYLFDILAKLTGRKLPISSIRVKKFCADTVVSSDAMQATKFIAPYSLEEGLRRMIKDIKLINNRD